MRWFGGLPHSLPDVERNNALQGAGAMQKKDLVMLFVCGNSIPCIGLKKNGW
jgi:hypothetical protein